MFQPVFTYRFMYGKVYPATLMGHLDVVRAFVRGARMSGLPVCYSKGYTPRPLVSFGQPLPFGDSGLEELVDVRFEARVSSGQAVEAINAGLPGGVRLTAGALIDPQAPSISAAAAAADHLVKIPISPERAAEAAEAFGSAGEFWVDIVKGERRKRRNLKEFVAKLECGEGDGGSAEASMIIRFLPRGTVPARESAVAIFGLGGEESSGVAVARGRFYKSLDPPVWLFIP